MASTTAPSTSRVVARASLRREQGDGARHRRGELVELLGVDEGRRPAHGEVEALAVGPLGAPQGRDDRAASDEAHGLDGHPAEPRHAGADALAAEAAAHRGEPPEAALDGDRQRGGLGAVGQHDVGVEAPARLGAADGLEAVGQLAVVRGRRVGTCGPHDDLARRPGGLEAHLTGRVGRGDGGDRVLDLGEQVVGRLEAGQLLLEVGHHLVALGPVDLPDRVELLLHVVEEALQGAAPAGRIGFELGQLLGGGRALGGRPRGGLQSTCCVGHRGPAPLGPFASCRLPPGGIPLALHRPGLGREAEHVKGTARLPREHLPAQVPLRSPGPPAARAAPARRPGPRRGGGRPRGAGPGPACPRAARRRSRRGSTRPGCRRCWR